MTDPTSSESPGRRRPGSIVFGIIVGLAVAWWSYQWITNPERRDLRAEQERAVLAARNDVSATVGGESLEIVDPLAPERSVGKVYVYVAGDGYEVSGYYRRDADDHWHAFLATISGDYAVAELKIRDANPTLKQRASTDPTLTVVDEAEKGAR